MYRLTLHLTGGHTVSASMPEDLGTAYAGDPKKFGTLLIQTLKQGNTYFVEDLQGRHVYIQPEHVVAWDVDPGTGAPSVRPVAPQRDTLVP
jgi:hypothetical protein